MIYQTLLKNTEKLIEITEIYDPKKFKEKNSHIITFINISLTNF